LSQTLGGTQGTGFRLQAAGYRLRATGCGLQVKKRRESNNHFSEPPVLLLCLFRLFPIIFQRFYLSLISPLLMPFAFYLLPVACSLNSCILLLRHSIFLVRYSIFSCKNFTWTNFQKGKCAAAIAGDPAEGNRDCETARNNELYGENMVPAEGIPGYLYENAPSAFGRKEHRG